MSWEQDLGQASQALFELSRTFGHQGTGEIIGVLEGLAESVSSIDVSLINIVEQLQEMNEREAKRDGARRAALASECAELK